MAMPKPGDFEKAMLKAPRLGERSPRGSAVSKPHTAVVPPANSGGCVGCARRREAIVRWWRQLSGWIDLG